MRDPAAKLAWHKALTGKAMTEADSALLRSSLQEVLLETGPSETSALHAHNGRRSFAAELLGLVEPPKATRPPVDRIPGRRIGREEQ